MIEITSGTLEERIIKFLQNTYPVTIKDINQSSKKTEEYEGIMYS